MRSSEMTKRQYALHELLSSERAYASDLALIRDIHLPLALGLKSPASNFPAPPDSSGSSTHSASSDSSAASLGPPMTTEDVKIIFSNITEISVVTDMFTEELELALGSVVEGGQGTDAVGALFLRMAPDLERPYNYYILRHSTSLQHLQSLPQTLPLQNYLTYTQTVSSSLSHAWDLASLLIKPVQRLLNYSLLLTAIIDETPDDHPDKENLRVARATIQELGRNIDQGRRRAEVVKDVLSSKLMKKKPNTSAGVTASTFISKIMSIRHGGVNAATMRVAELEGANSEAMEVEALQAELKRIELFAKEFAKTMVDWGKMTSNMMLTLRTWLHSFGTVIGLAPGQDSEAFDALLEAVEKGLLPLASELESTINDRILKDLAHLLMSMNQPLKLIASMNEQEPYHYQFLTTLINAKHRPLKFLTASNNYLALRGQLVADLPAYIRLLHKILATLVRRFAEIQKVFWGGVRDRWVGLWNMLRAETEFNVGMEETCAVWLMRWTEVHQLLIVLTITKPVQDVVVKYLTEREHRRNQLRLGRNRGLLMHATRPVPVSKVSVMTRIEEGDEDDTQSSAQIHADFLDRDTAHPTDTEQQKPAQTNKALQRSTKPVQTREVVGDYKTTLGNDQTDACSLFSVQSFEPQIGLSSDMIVTVGIPSGDPTETPFKTDSRTSSTPSRSIRRLSFHSAVSFMDASPDNLSEMISDYWSLNSSKMFESRSERRNFRAGNESNRVSSFEGSVDGNWDRVSVISRDTFETAQEPPPELLLALGLHLDPVSRRTPLPSTSDLHESPLINVTGSSRNEGLSNEAEPLDQGKSITDSKGQSPPYSVSFIRDVSNVSIIGSQINFTTTIMHNDEDVRVGLHKLYLRSDPTALHNSYERQLKMNQQMKAIRAWGSQLSITSSSTPGEYPLSVPSIKALDLEQVVKDVFTWLYSTSTSHSIMWLYEHELEGNLRTSLIGQCLANFLGERRDLTASYFYTKRSTPSPLAGTDGRGDNNPSSIIPTIAYELTRRIPPIKIPIGLTAATDLWIFDLSLNEQMKHLIVDPLLTQAAASNNGNSYKFPQLFLIHGLEDCGDHDFQELFLYAFGKSLGALRKSVPQKLLFLGKHTAHLGECFSKPEMQGVVRHCVLPVSKDVEV